MSARNRFDLPEWSGAFGDLGTLVPFFVAYITTLGVDPNGMLVSFGIALIVVGAVHRTPFPVQPMKAAGTVAVSQAAIAQGMNAAMVSAATLMTGLIWLLLALTGLAEKIARWVPRPALLGVVMGLGFSFMLEGVRMMGAQPVIAAALLPLTLLMLSRPRLPAMLVLLAIGMAIALIQHPELPAGIAAIQPEFRLPSLAVPALTPSQLWLALILLALPQLPLTFGNALVAVTAENNRHFPDRPVSERQVAWSTAIMNLGAGGVGGVPMCHGAGGMAGHVQFGARTGGSSIILGALLLAAGLFLSGSLSALFALFPASVLGVILFLAGVQLALGSRDADSEKADRFVLLATAGLVLWNAGIAIVFGIAAHAAARRGWLRL